MLKNAGKLVYFFVSTIAKWKYFNFIQIAIYRIVLSIYYMVNFVKLENKLLDY